MTAATIPNHNPKEPARQHPMDLRRWLLINLAVAVCYAFAGHAGLLMSVPPANISPIWPAAGVALAFALTFGRSSLPGIFLGSFLVHLTAFLDASSLQALLHSLAVGLGTSTGSMLQALAGCWLIQRRVTQPLVLLRELDVLHFMLFGGLLACTVAPSVGVLTLYLASAVPTDRLLVSWGTWWVGDATGVIIIAPLLLTLIGRPAEHWIPRRSTLAVPLLISLSLVVLLFLYANNQVHERTDTAFRTLANTAFERLRGELADIRDQLNGIVALTVASERVTQDEFVRFTRQLNHSQSIRALYWIPQDAQHTGLSWRHAEDKCPSTSPPAPDFNTLSADQAINARYAPLPCPTLFLYQPSIPADRRAAPANGISVVAIDPNALLASTLDTHLPDTAWLRIALWTPKRGRQTLIERSEPPAHYSIASSSEPSHATDISLGDAHLEIQAGLNTRYMTSQHGWEVWVLLTGGLAFSALLGIGLLILTGRHARTEQLVAERTGALASEVEERSTAERQLELQNGILERIARDEPLRDTLVFLCRQFEQVSRPLTYASVMLYDENASVLRLIAGPSLPPPVAEALKEFPVGEDEGSCGTAVHRGQQVVCSNIAVDREWDKYRELALSHDLHACWSTPFHDRSGRVLGSFALTQGESRSPEPQDERHIRSALFLCSLAVEQWQAKEHISDLSLALEQSPSAVVMADLSGRIEYANQRFCELTGFGREDAYGRPLDELLRSDPESGFVQAIWEDAKTGQEWRGTVRNFRSDGSDYWAQYHVSAMRDETGEINHILVIQDDVTALRESTAKVVYQATHDLLTGLLNRHEFEVNLERRLEEARRYDQQHVLCFIDLDQFKIINDSSGHAAGDELLRQLGTLMRQHIRKTDILARIGGDEFAVLFEHCQMPKALANVEKLRQLISEHPFSWDQRSYSVGMSAGLVEITADSPSADELVREADAACYTAKETGRDRVQVYSPDNETTARRSSEMRWVATLRSALNEERFELFHQRIQYLDREDRYGMEILLRLRGEDGELVPPGQFLPAAERYGLALQLDAWVVQHTLQLLADDRQLLSELEYCSINLSALSLTAEFAGRIRDWLAQYPVAPYKLCFEITETAAISNLTLANDFINGLRERGVRFALDDFGSGLSSFAYLKNLPVDILKIDGQFVRDILSDPIDLAMVRAINEIGKVMGKQTVAEFVEHPEIVSHLRGLSVDAVQGYAIGRPEPLQAPL